MAYPFPNFNSAAIEVWACNGLYILELQLIHVSKATYRTPYPVPAPPTSTPPQAVCIAGS